MIKKCAIALSAAAVMMMSGGSAVAGEEPRPVGECGFNAQQIAGGFYCTIDDSTIQVSREIGGGSRCQDATVSQTIFRWYNKNGGLMDSRTVTGEPEQSDWGSSYPIGDGCNNPLL